MKIFASGSRVPARLRDAFAGAGVALYVEYGAREASGISSTYPLDLDPSLETVGPPLPTAELEIVDGDGNPAPRGEIGEIRVRTTAMIHAYHGDPVATARHFKDGWFHPGDLGSLTANGSLCLHGRADDMMNMNGIKIFPAEIERLLEGDPAVRAAAAFALPSSVHGEIPVAAVELHDPATLSVAALLARARERLGVRSPRKIFVVDALPRNATGKILRRELVSLLSQPNVRDE
ncbi:MAG: long-chain fatty acid--CoA ligase [Betaproteobacteria bacterium]|nr:long-chain fatty acid--CoA ligase [Betaproteobacteria bacterium]